MPMLAVAAFFSFAVAEPVGQGPDTLPAQVLQAARRRQEEVNRLRLEAANRDAATQATVARLSAGLRTASADLDRTAAAVAQSQSREQRFQVVADAAPSLISRVRSAEERLLAASRAVSLRAADRVVIIEKGLEALRLKARALHGTALAFNAGFDLSSLASPASFTGFEASIKTLRGLTSERQRPALDLVVDWLTKGVPGIPIVGSLAGVVLNAFGAGGGDSKRAGDVKKAGERILCIAAVSQTALERLGSVRRASARLERLSVEVEQRASRSGGALRGAVAYQNGESFEAYVRRSYGDLAPDSARRELPYVRLETAMLSVAAAARLEYDLSRSSADLGAMLEEAMVEPPPAPACAEESRELGSRYERLRPAVRDLRASLAALAAADDGIAVFVPPLPGR